jgi:hypothetical protein
MRDEASEPELSLGCNTIEETKKRLLPVATRDAHSQLTVRRQEGHPLE